MMPETQAKKCLNSTSSGYLLKDFIKYTVKIETLSRQKNGHKKSLTNRL